MNEDVKFTIGQIAKIFGNTKEALRFYQRKNLVQPSISANGYRLYSVDDCLQLLYLKRFSSMSLSLDGTLENLSAQSNADVLDVVEYL